MNRPASPAAPRGRMLHHGSGAELFVIFIVNLFLRIVTLGVYHFWAKTRVRRYLWSHAAFDDERFEYTGTGMELFIGFLKAIGLMLLTIVVIAAVMWGLALFNPTIAAIVGVFVYLGAYIGVFYLIGFALYSARRYMLSRTRLRNIRFAQTGSSVKYANLFIGHGFLTAITMGIYTPFMRNRLNGYMIDHMHYGHIPAKYTGDGADLIGRFMIAYFLTLPTLGLIWFWYSATEARYIAAHIHFEKLRFNVTYTGMQLFWLTFSNLLLLVVTLGLAFPWILLRTINFTLRHLEIEGQLDYAAIAQSPERMPKSGEGLFEALDLGSI